MLKPELLKQAMAGTYSFCTARECPVVYFESQHGLVFTVDDLRLRVGVKVSGDPIPLCYCFGFDESHLRDEIVRTGKTTIPEQISRLIHEGLCACETRNPSGVCCLGAVKKVAEQLTPPEQSFDGRESNV
jgi:Zinc binding domain